MGTRESSFLKQKTCRAVAFLGGSEDQESACNARDLGWTDALEKEMATYSGILV